MKKHSTNVFVIAGMIVCITLCTVTIRSMASYTQRVSLVQGDVNRSKIRGGTPCNENTQQIACNTGTAPACTMPVTGTLFGVCGNTASPNICESFTTQPNNQCIAQNLSNLNCQSNTTNTSCGTQRFGVRPMGQNCGTGDCSGMPQGCGAVLVTTSTNSLGCPPSQ
jgi:hypothetical protein